MNIMVKVVDPVRVERRRSPLQAVDFVTFGQE
jgi:hypothetical protein